MHISISSDPKDSLTFRKKLFLMCISPGILVLGIFHFRLLSGREGRKEKQMDEFGVPMHLKRNKQASQFYSRNNYWIIETEET